MNLTEKEAQRKYCPHGMGCGLMGCLASECAAWRWALLPSGHRMMGVAAPPSNCPDCGGHGGACSTCDGDGKIGHFEPVGYCGLAGKPEDLV